MSNINNLFNSAKTTIEQRAKNLKNSPTYREFTQKFIVALGNTVLKEFSGIDIELKARVKSDKSIKNKIEKNSSDYARKQTQSDILIDINDYSLFDIYGGKLVILNVSDEFKSKHLSIDGFIMKRQKALSLTEKAKAGANSNDLQSREISRLNSVIFQEIDAMCQRYVSDAICKFIMGDNALRNEFGIYSLDSRYRDYNMSNEYIAKHITLGSSKLPGWYLELQFKSLIDYEIARTGEAAHINRDGKDIEIPNSLDEVDFSSVPEYIIYAEKNMLYIPSKKKCLFHYLEPAFYQRKSQAKNPEVLTELFKNFSDDDGGTFKTFE